MLISHILRRNVEGTWITLVCKVQFLCSPPSFLDGYKNMTETTDIVNTIKSTKPQCMITFLWGEKGWWMGRE